MEDGVQTMLNKILVTISMVLFLITPAYAENVEIVVGELEQEAKPVDNSSIIFVSGYSISKSPGLEPDIAKNKDYYLIQFYSPLDRVDPETLNELEELGVALLDYIPNNAFYAIIPEDAFEPISDLIAENRIRYVGEIPSAAKIEPDAFELAQKNPDKSYKINVKFFEIPTMFQVLVFDEQMTDFAVPVDEKYAFGTAKGKDMLKIYELDFVKWVEMETPIKSSINSPASLAKGSPLDPFVQRLTSAGAEYAEGKISQEELACRAIGTEYLIQQKNEAFFRFFFSIEDSEIKNKYEVVFDEDEWKNESWMHEDIKAPDEENIKKKVLDSLIYSQKKPKQVTVYYNLLGDKPIAIYLIIQRDWVYYSQYFFVDIAPIPYGSFKNDMGFREKCLENYLKSEASESIKEATQLITSIKKRGTETSSAEWYLDAAKGLFDKGNYRESLEQVDSSIRLAYSLKNLNEYRSLSDEEKIWLLREKFSKSSTKEKYTVTKTMSEEDIGIASLGLIYNLICLQATNPTQ